jgi:predicted RNA-binding Zn ribbon-like protein
VKDQVLRFADGGWAEQVGNDLALDLVNTVAWRRDPARRVDRLTDVPALLAWARFVDLADEATEARRLERSAARDPRAADAALARVRELRERLHAVALPIARGAEPDAADVQAVHTELLEALGRADVGSVMPLTWLTGLHSMDGLADRLAVRAWQLLQRDTAGRLRECRDDSCGWLFLDRSRNGSRIWCSSADCGNRSRARRHYRRRRAEAPPAEVSA